jgi:antiviral helicase SKI2
VFSLSKKKCELSVQGLQSLDLTNQAEKSSIHVMTETALSRLKSEDRELPQILRVSEMLKRGIGIHHSGLLPIVKELVEMVFSKGLVKVLFATETFAMGVNMPTRTVVFNGLRKFDGRTFRDIYPGEYTQMAGRAGRRGLDSFGTVIINCADNELPDETVCQQMILGKPTKLISQFRLTYNMILNLMRVEDIRVEDMIKRSFGEFNSQKDVPEKQMNLEKQEEKLKRIDTGNSIVCMYDEPYLIDDYYEAFHQMNAANAWMMRFIINSKQGKKFLNPGRVVSVSKFGMIERPAIILSIENSDRPSEMCMYTVLILTPDGWSPDSTTRKIMSSEPITNVFHSSYLITVIRAANLIYISDRVLNINGASIRVDKKATEISKAVTSLRKLEDGIEEFSWLDPIENMNIDNLEFHDYYDKWNRAYSYLEGSKCHSCQKQESHFQLAQKKFLLKQQVNSLRLALSEDNIELISDFNLRVDVLKKLKYVNSDRTVQLKGRVACEINTCESLIVTEMIFENVFTSLSPEECVAILSCFVFQQKTDDQPKISDELAYALGKMISIATDLANLQKEHKIDISPQSFIHDNINPGLVEVVHEWAKGTPFKEICTLTTVEEGVIVRCITRLDETCRDLRNAARVIGDQKLFEKMENASTLIKRDIVFAASLYVT